MTERPVGAARMCPGDLPEDIQTIRRDAYPRMHGSVIRLWEPVVRIRGHRKQPVRTPSDEAPPRNNQRLPTYVQFDVRLDREWLFQRWARSLFLDVLNLTYSETVFSVSYPTVAGIPQYDQPTLNGLRWILPSIGLRGRL